MKRLVAQAVTPAKAGIQNILKRLDSRFRRNDSHHAEFVVNPTAINKITGFPA
jgi:hypothetical protein